MYQLNGYENDIATPLHGMGFGVCSDTALDTAVGGQSFGKGLKRHLQSGLGRAIAGYGAQEIGKAYKLGKTNYMTHKLSHGALAGGVELARGGKVNQAVGSAVGATAGEMLGEQLVRGAGGAEKVHESGRAGLIKDLSGVVGGVVSQLSGGDFTSGQLAAETAVENNALSPLDYLALADDVYEIGDHLYERDYLGAVGYTGMLVVDGLLGAFLPANPLAAAKSTKLLKRGEQLATIAGKGMDKLNKTMHKPGRVMPANKNVQNLLPKKSPKNVNAQKALNKKMRSLQKAQNLAHKVKKLPDGRVRYYTKETPSYTPGKTRGRSHVTEHNPKTGQVRSWSECYDQKGKVNRVHPKNIDGKDLKSQHYPPTKKELESFSKVKVRKK